MTMFPFKDFRQHKNGHCVAWEDATNVEISLTMRKKKKKKKAKTEQKNSKQYNIKSKKNKILIYLQSKQKTIINKSLSIFFVKLEFLLPQIQMKKKPIKTTE